MRKFIFFVFLSFILVFLVFTRQAYASTTLYTWTPSKLYKASTGTAYKTKINSGVAVVSYGETKSRYQIKVGNQTGYIKAYNLSKSKVKKEDYFGSKIYKQAKSGTYVASFAAGKEMYIKNEASKNGMYLAHVIGTSYSGYVYQSHFIKPTTKYDWTPSKLYTSSKGQSYKLTLDSGKTVSVFNEANGRYQVRSGSNYGYIKAYNLANTLTKKTVYATSKLYTTSSHTKYTAMVAVSKKVYVKESAGSMYHVHVIGTSANGWIYQSHFTQPEKDQNPTRKGADVSHYQKLTQTSFNNMKSAGYSFVILKATEGTFFTDPTFYANYKYARKAGLTVHAYHMIGNSATTQSAQIAEAKYFYNVLSQTKAESGYSFTGYAFEDVETTSTNGITTPWLEDDAPKCIGYFLNEMKTLGQSNVGLYTQYSSWSGYLKGHTSPWPSNTKIWLAHYNETLGTSADVWQYTNTGTIDGIDGSLDLDISYDSGI